MIQSIMGNAVYVVFMAFQVVKRLERLVSCHDAKKVKRMDFNDANPIDIDAQQVYKLIRG